MPCPTLLKKVDLVRHCSCKFSTGYIDFDMGLPVVEKEYLVGLTCEKPRPDEHFAIKLRIMLASVTLLRGSDWRNPPGFERHGHIARWECLECMHRILLQDDALAKTEGPRAYTQQLLRKVTIFRPAPALAAHPAAVPSAPSSCAMAAAAAAPAPATAAAAANGNSRVIPGSPPKDSPLQAYPNVASARWSPGSTMKTLVGSVGSPREAARHQLIKGLVKKGSPVVWR